MKRDTRSRLSKLSRKKTPSGGLHLVVFGAHPDDAELVAGGSLAKMARLGYRVGIVDATRGEAGSRGTPAARAREAARAARILGVAVRENLGLPDAHLEVNEEARRAVTTAIRRLRPEIVVVPYEESRHPDHRALFTLVRDAFFLAALRRWRADGAPWTPRHLLYALAYQRDLQPGFLVDISDVFHLKERAIRTFASQLAGARSLGDIRSSDRPLLETIRVIHGYYGWLIGRRFAEPFLMANESTSVQPASLLED
jgi:bacillithiol biosynthesis deacetylase BshB1